MSRYRLLTGSLCLMAGLCFGDVVLTPDAGAGGGTLDASFLSNLVVRTEGGYASDYFWVPSYVPHSVFGGTNFVVDDVIVRVADGATRQDYLLRPRVDERPTVHALAPLDVVWTLDEADARLGSIDGDVFRTLGVQGVANIRAEGSDGSVKHLKLPIPELAGGAVLRRPYADVPGTFRESVSQYIIDMFDTNAVHASHWSRYRFHRETAFGDLGSSDWSYPDIWQVFETDGLNTDAHDPRTVNHSFAEPALAKALLCRSSWRGDWFAHRPYIAIAPHYAISVSHWKQNNRSAPWCVDWENETWMTNVLDRTTGHEDPGRVGALADVSIHRFVYEFPTNIVMRFMRQSELRKVSPSMLVHCLGVTYSSHNTVHPTELRPWYWSDQEFSVNKHENWSGGYGYQAAFLPDLWLDTRDYKGIGTLVHNTHLWDSGHLSAFWINGVLVPVGTFTYVGGGGNSFLSDPLLDSIKAVVEADSGGAETIQFISSEELVP